MINVDKPITDYYFSRTVIQKVLSVKELGIIYDSKMAFFEHCYALANKGFFHILLRCSHSRDRELQIKLFYRFVRPILEYNSPVWSPHLKQNIKTIEQVQKFFTKNLRVLKNIPYIQRLLVLNQPKL